MRLLFIFLLCATTSFTAYSQKKSSPAHTPPALSAIKESDLKRDLFELSSDEMRGKRAGTLDELRAAAWVAEQARKAGLKPAGDDGTYFQFFPLRRTSIADNSNISINGKPARLWKDAWVTAPVDGQLDAPVVWLKSLADTSATLKGKVVAMNLLPPSRLPAKGMSLWVYRYALSAIRQQADVLKKQGVAGIVLVADSIAASDIGFFGHAMEEGVYQLEGSTAPAPNTNAIPVVLVQQSWARDLQQPNAKIKAHLRANSYIYPSVNVVAVAPGSDATLKKEHVLFSGHHDHDGVGVPVAGDSIWNGADDNASVTVAMLAIGRAWTKNPGKRSALFVWHGAEERGLHGSRFYVQHPTVKKESIVAVLNGDMIGRNAPDSAALLGSIPPHRTSEELVNMALNANNKHTKFKLDTSWDEASHPERWYFRSDHLPYAQAGIPSIFFTTLLHPDYHTPRDEAERIDINKLTKMTKWMYATGWAVANTPARPALDKGANVGER
jgi:hypothetical protein